MQIQAKSEEWTIEQDRKISDVVGRERNRLRNFIRRRVHDAGDAEDILQEVFYELVEAVRFADPVEQIGAWLFRVARNRIIDLFRKKKAEPIAGALADPVEMQHGQQLSWEELLPSAGGGPE